MCQYPPVYCSKHQSLLGVQRCTEGLDSRRRFNNSQVSDPLPLFPFPLFFFFWGSAWDMYVLVRLPTRPGRQQENCCQRVYDVVGNSPSPPVFL